MWQPNPDPVTHADTYNHPHAYAYAHANAHAYAHENTFACASASVDRHQ
jgi:hypothetical protein